METSITGEVLISRTVKAPREKVFGAWTTASQLEQWFAPTGCTIRFLKHDFREGGAFHSCLVTPDGYECWAKGVFLEINEPSQLVFVMAVTNSDGDLVEPIDVGMDPEWPRETVVTVTFANVEDGTLMTLHQTVSATIAKRTGAYGGWGLMFDRLDQELALQQPLI